MDSEKFKHLVRQNIKDLYSIDAIAPITSSEICCNSCGNPLVKPNTVLYGRSLRVVVDLNHVGGQDMFDFEDIISRMMRTKTNTIVISFCRVLAMKCLLNLPWNVAGWKSW